MIQQTRFKLALVGLFLGLVEGVLKSFLTAFPIAEVLGFEGLVIGYFFTVKTVDNVKRLNAATEQVESENGNGAPKP